MYRYYITGTDVDSDYDFAERGIVAAKTYGEAVTKVAEYYGEHIQGTCINEIQAYELMGILCDDEINEMQADDWHAPLQILN